MPAGTFYYCFSYGYGPDDRYGLGLYSKDTYTVTATTTGTGHVNQVTLSGFPASPSSIQSHINQIHVWRTLRDSLVEGPYFYLGAVSGTSFVDDRADFELQTAHPKLEEGIPPQGNLVEWHDGRLYIADLQNGESEAMFSNYNEPDYFESINRIGIPGSDEKILGMRSYLEKLLFFTGRGVYALYGNEFDNFAFRKLAATPCTVGRSPVIVNDECWFLGPDGVYGVRGDQTYRVIEVYRGRVANAVGAALVIKPDVNPAYVVWGDEPWMVDVRTRTLRTLDIDQSADPDEWMNACNDAQDLVDVLQNDGSHKYYTGGHGIAYTAGTDAVHRFELFAYTTAEDQGRDDTNTDDVAYAFQCQFRSAEFDAGRPGAFKMMELLEVVFDQSITPDNGTTAEVKVYADGDYSIAVLTHTIQSGDQHLKIRGGVVARTIAIDILWTDSTNRIALDEVLFHFKELPARWE
jgi:hypothetical protein